MVDLPERKKFEDMFLNTTDIQPDKQTDRTTALHHAAKMKIMRSYNIQENEYLRTTVVTDPPLNLSGNGIIAILGSQAAH